MSKTETLISRMGSGLAESIGLRAGQSPRPTYPTTQGETPKTDFVRSRSTGDIHPSEVMPDPDQPRKHFDPDEITNLANDIKVRTQLQPIRVRWSAPHGKWLIIAGERRWRAVQEAGLDRISCIFIDKDMSESEIRSEQLVENLLREDLTGIEEAKAYRALMQLNGWSATDLSQGINVSKGKVSKALSLLKLPQELQARVERGEISPSTAYELSKAKSGTEQNELAELAADGKITQEEAARATQRQPRNFAARRNTNQDFRTHGHVRVSIVARRDIGDEGMIEALLEAIEMIRARAKKGKAA